MMCIYTFQTVGLMFDGLGAVLLGFAFFSRNLLVDVYDEVVVGRTEAGWQGKQVEARLGQRFDGIRGTAFLVTGFLLQAVGVWLSFCSPLLALLPLAALVWAWHYYRIGRQKLIERSKGVLFRKLHPVRPKV